MFLFWINACEWCLELKHPPSLPLPAVLYCVHYNDMYVGTQCRWHGYTCIDSYPTRNPYIAPDGFVLPPFCSPDTLACFPVDLSPGLPTPPPALLSSSSPPAWLQMGDGEVRPPLGRDALLCIRLEEHLPHRCCLRCGRHAALSASFEPWWWQNLWHTCCPCGGLWRDGNPRGNA